MTTPTDSSSETPAIDEKRKEEEKIDETTGSRLVKYLRATVPNAIHIFVYFAIGALVLYGTKIAQANILPTDRFCYPYVPNVKPEVEEISTNIFPTWLGETTLTAKLSFPPANTWASKDTIANKTYAYFSQLKTSAGASSTTAYLSTIMESLFIFNNWLLNSVFQWYNYLPEAIVFLLGPFLFTIAGFLASVGTFFYTLYLWLSNLGWFLKKNINTTGEGSAEWEDIPAGFTLPFATSCIFIWIFIAIFFVFFFLGVFQFGSPIITGIVALFALSTQGLIGGQKVGAPKIVQLAMKNYKVILTSLFSLFQIVDAYNAFGSIGAVYAVLAILLVFLGTIPLGLYRSYPHEEATTPEVSYDPAKRQCAGKNPTAGLGEEEEEGLLGGMLRGGGWKRRGTPLSRQLKKLASKK